VPIASPAPAERSATLLLWLGRAADSRYRGGWLTGPLIIRILNRLREIKQRFARVAARLAAGHCSPRKSGGPRPGRPPGRPNRLPTSVAWLIKLVPEAAASASQLRTLLADPEMAALLAAAPVPMARTLRPLCRMLGVDVPPMLAPPPSARPKTSAPPPAEAAGEARPAQKPKRPNKPPSVRYVFGLRYPPPLPDPA
jgi:hypothetical protein